MTAITGVPNGSYNLVAMQVVAKAGGTGACKESVTRTAAVTVSGNGTSSKVSFGTNDTTGRIVMPSGDTSSLVEVMEDTPPIIVGGLDTVTVGSSGIRSVSVSKEDDTTYTYIQPGMDVKINVTFRAATNTAWADCSKNGSCPINQFTDADAKAWYHDGVH